MGTAQIRKIASGSAKHCRAGRAKGDRLVLEGQALEENTVAGDPILRVVVDGCGRPGTNHRPTGQERGSVCSTLRLRPTSFVVRRYCSGLTGPRQGVRLLQRMDPLCIDRLVHDQTATRFPNGLGGPVGRRSGTADDGAASHDPAREGIRFHHKRAWSPRKPRIGRRNSKAIWRRWRETSRPSWTL